LLRSDEKNFSRRCPKNLDLQKNISAFGSLRNRVLQKRVKQSFLRVYIIGTSLANLSGDVVKDIEER
jgi:hypothetical protein